MSLRIRDHHKLLFVMSFSLLALLLVVGVKHAVLGSEVKSNAVKLPSIADRNSVSESKAVSKSILPVPAQKLEKLIQQSPSNPRVPADIENKTKALDLKIVDLNRRLSNLGYNPPAKHHKVTEQSDMVARLESIRMHMKNKTQKP